MLRFWSHKTIRFIWLVSLIGFQALELIHMNVYTLIYVMQINVYPSRPHHFLSFGSSILTLFLVSVRCRKYCLWATSSLLLDCCNIMYACKCSTPYLQSYLKNGWISHFNLPITLWSTQQFHHENFSSPWMNSPNPQNLV